MNQPVPAVCLGPCNCTPELTSVAICTRCGHPSDWHRLDDSTNVSPLDPTAECRCIGYDCTAPGPVPPGGRACDCPDMVRPDRVWHVEYTDRELYGPSIDVCGWCGDSECDGIGCIASLDPDDPDDQRALEQLHAWIRRGRYFEQVERVLAESENRTVPTKWGTS